MTFYCMDVILWCQFHYRNKHWKKFIMAIKASRRANSSVWWPRMSDHITKMVKSCPGCTKNSFQNCEPMIASSLPNYPRQIIGTDLFQHKDTTYLLVVDYFSRYPKIAKLTDTTSKGVIAALRPMFARHGIPEVVRSDNGPQYVSQEMTDFATSYGFTQVTSSPHYPRSNGLAERTVKTVKAMLKKSKDPHLALLNRVLLVRSEPSTAVNGKEDKEYIATSPT